MLHLYTTATVKLSMLQIDRRTFTGFNRKWFNTPEAIYCIEKLDGNKNIGDGVSDSPWLGIIPPQMLSGGCKAMVYAMSNPDEIVPLDFCGNNCAPILEHISKTRDLTMVYAASNFIFTDTIPIHCVEHDEVVIGDEGYLEYLRKYDMASEAYWPYKIDWGGQYECK